MKEEKFMQKCLKLAEKGRPFVSPNPMVGAVVEKNGKIIACGFHARFGREHAETIALKRAGKAAKGAQLFVNLEPCCHLGKQPPCTQAIIKAGIKKVVVATIDPNPLINGKGVKELKKHGIVVKTGVLEKEAQELNEKFFKYKKTGLPFVLVKNAISANRVLAGKKISGKKSIQKVHLLRSEFDAILAGANTVIKDNPKLTARFKGTRNTLRMIVDSRAKIPIDSKVFDKKAPTIIVCTKKAKKNRVKKIVQKGAGILIAKEKNGKVDLKNMLLQLGKSGVSSVLVEGGAQITKSFLKEKLADKFILIISPITIKEKKDFLQGKKLLKDFEIKKTGFVGNDCWVTLYPQKKF